MTFLVSAVDTLEHQAVHSSMTAMARHELQYMLGQHNWRVDNVDLVYSLILDRVGGTSSVWVPALLLASAPSSTGSLRRQSPVQVAMRSELPAFVRESCE